MQLSVFWYILAGFLLGFTTSTLWEWFHFRRERVKLRDRRIRELEARLRDQEISTSSEDAAPAEFEDEDLAWSAPEYRSPGIFLETEELEPEPDALEGAPALSEPPLRMNDGATETVELTPPQPEPVVRPARNPLVGRIPAVTDANASPIAETPGARMPLGIRPGGLAARNHAAAPIKPGIAPKRTENYPDDLSKIKGIGDVYRKRLYAAGIYTWHQIAETDPESLRAATNAYPSSNVEEWPVQARQLVEKHGRQNAIYTGPPPDDLTTILGIGPISAQTLYRVGICTYEQLADTPVESLAALFPIAVAGDQPDFASWVEQAKQLASRKSA